MPKLLIVDDTLENRTAALVAEPTADIAVCAAQAKEIISVKNYDFVLTDLDMETTLAGLEVVTAALAKGIPAYTVSHSGKGHTGEIVKLSPYNFRSTNLSEGKANPEYWRQAIDSILNCTSEMPEVQRQYHKVVRGRSMSLDEHTLFAVFVGDNYSIIKKLREERGQK